MGFKLQGQIVLDMISPLQGNRDEDSKDHMREFAGNFMKVWSFFITKVTRELTLLSATSFGECNNVTYFT